MDPAAALCMGGSGDTIHPFACVAQEHAACYTVDEPATDFHPWHVLDLDVCFEHACLTCLHRSLATIPGV